jgi:hypothetical protein
MSGIRGMLQNSDLTDTNGYTDHTEYFYVIFEMM